MKFPEAIAILAKGGTVTANRLHYLGFKSGAKFISETFGPVRTFDGQVWDGIGDVVSVEGGGYQSGAVATNLKLTIGASSDLLTDPLIAAALGSEDEVYGRRYFQAIQFFDDEGQIVDRHFANYVGMMDQITFSHAADLRKLTLNVESPFVRRRSARVSYFSDADQRGRYSTDATFEFISSLANKTITWPKY